MARPVDEEGVQRESSKDNYAIETQQETEHL